MHKIVYVLLLWTQSLCFLGLGYVAEYESVLINFLNFLKRYGKFKSLISLKG